LVVAGVALIAGADPTAAARLGLSMTALQVSIGSVNDVVDAPRDRDAKPGKPIPAGVVSHDTAVAVAATSGGLGLLIGWLSGPAVLLLGVIVLAIGYGYDLVFKGTAWSWLPFAVGIPLLPIYGWVGTTGDVPPTFAVLIPAAVVAGAALAVANARADEERDRATGTVSVATRLGSRRSWQVEAVLLVGVVGTAGATLLAAGGVPVALVAAAVASAIIAAGLVVGRSDTPSRRERAWEIEAVGVALLAAAWLAGVPLAG
jgi:4-hydroxybenzoate polyprenyltransferase